MERFFRHSVNKLSINLLLHQQGRQIVRLLSADFNIEYLYEIRPPAVVLDESCNANAKFAPNLRICSHSEIHFDDGCGLRLTSRLQSSEDIFVLLVAENERDGVRGRRFLRRLMGERTHLR